MTYRNIVTAFAISAIAFSAVGAQQGAGDKKREEGLPKAKKG